MNTSGAIRVLSALILAGMVSAAGAAEVAYRYQFTLADFDGPIPLLGARVRFDAPRDEAYVQQGNTVRIFGSSGMETYSFLMDPALGSFVDLAIEPEGGIDLLGYKPGSVEGSGFFVLRCDYRGRPVGEIIPSGLPAGMQDFAPETLVLSQGRYFLASSSRMAVAVLDETGAVAATADLAELAGLEPEKRQETMYGGFTVDPAGRMVFSLPTDFSVRIVSVDGTVRLRVGESGTRPGQFGVVGAVAADADGNLYVADKLRNRVLLFDGRQQFLAEFGRPGDGVQSFVIPSALAVSADRLFVSQMRNRGVTVFARAAAEAADEAVPASPFLQMPGSRRKKNG